MSQHAREIDAEHKLDLITTEPKLLKNRWNGTTRDSLSWEVYCGDSKHIVSQLPQKHFNCVVTSPPYYSLRDYDVDGQIGLEETAREYLDAILAVMEQVKRVMTDDGVLFLNLGDTYYSGKGKSHGIDKKSSKRRFGLRPVDKSGGLGLGLQRKSAIGIPWRVSLAMAESGWVLRSAIIWHRKNALPEAVLDRPRRSYEYVFMFVKQRRYYFNREALQDIVVAEDVWTIQAKPKSTNGIDTAPYPDELVQRCLQIGCPKGGTILDPFAGAGTTLRAGLHFGCHVVGIDLNRDFCRHMTEEMSRVAQCT